MSGGGNSFKSAGRSPGQMQHDQSMANWQQQSPQFQQQQMQQNLAQKQNSAFGGLLGGGMGFGGGQRVYQGGSATFDESGGQPSLPQSQDPFAIPGQLAGAPGQLGGAFGSVDPNAMQAYRQSLAGRPRQEVAFGGGMQPPGGAGATPLPGSGHRSQWGAPSGNGSFGNPPPMAPQIPQQPAAQPWNPAYRQFTPEQTAARNQQATQARMERERLSRMRGIPSGNLRGLLGRF